MILADKIIENRKKNGWSQEKPADKLGVSRQSVSKWESAQSVPDMKKILQLSEIFGVTTDYLLGLSETKKHAADDINSLRLSDELIEILQQGKINVPLFCELASHKDFPKLLADIELYANRFAAKAIEFLNAFVNTGREQIIQKSKPIQPDHFLDMLSDIQVDEGNYFDRRIHDDLDAIVKDIRDIIEISTAADTATKANGVRMTSAERKKLIEQLESKMRKAAQMLEYEIAAQLRDEIIRLRGEK